MKIFNNPPKETWPELAQRPQLELEFLESAVRNMLNRVKKSGDSALRELTLQFDKVSIQNFLVSKEEIQKRRNQFQQTYKNPFALRRPTLKNFMLPKEENSLKIETMPGVTCWRKAVPIDKVGIYIPAVLHHYFQLC